MSDILEQIKQAETENPPNLVLSRVELLLDRAWERNPAAIIGKNNTFKRTNHYKAIGLIHHAYYQFDFVTQAVYSKEVPFAITIKAEDELGAYKKVHTRASEIFLRQYVLEFRQREQQSQAYKGRTMKWGKPPNGKSKI